jgi:hypothetical protein
MVSEGNPMHFRVIHYSKFVIPYILSNHMTSNLPLPLVKKMTEQSLERNKGKGPYETSS